MPENEVFRKPLARRLLFPAILMVSVCVIGVAVESLRHKVHVTEYSSMQELVKQTKLSPDFEKLPTTGAVKWCDHSVLNRRYSKIVGQISQEELKRFFADIETSPFDSFPPPSKFAFLFTDDSNSLNEDVEDPFDRRLSFLHSDGLYYCTVRIDCNSMTFEIDLIRNE